MNRRIQHSRATSSITSRIGEVLARRKGLPIAQGQVSVTGGGIVEIAEDSTPLTDILAKSRMLGREARSTEYLHVSDLIGKCIRKIALTETLKMPAKPQSLSLTDSLTFAQGDAIHDVLKARVATGAPGQIWGNWECRCGTSKTASPGLLAEQNSDQRCPACKGPLSVYVEVPIFDKDLMIVGTPDLLTLVPEQGCLHISELKSISHDAWKELVRPIPEHVIQVLFYWYLMNKAGYRLTNRVSILYATKGWLFGKSPTKEFVIDAQGQMDRLSIYLQSAEQVKATRSGGSLPKRINCVSPQSPEAKKCDVCNACFGGSDDSRPVQVSISEALGTSNRTSDSRTISRRK